MQRKWQAIRNVSNGATVSLFNIGNEHMATHGCAAKLRDMMGTGFFDEKLGYPRFVIPNGQLSKVLTFVSQRISVALVDTGYCDTARNGTTRMVTLWIVRPAPAPTFNLAPATTGRTRSDVPNMSAEPKRGPAPAKKATTPRVIRAR